MYFDNSFSLAVLLTMPWTSYPLSSKSSAKYEPSWPVIPDINATLEILTLLIKKNYKYILINYRGFLS